uniref:Uncharacterized protein n=1 Tax=Rhizophora mucronata TaxID=61149 RepID=A0A2P2QJ67_RHIMU
MAVLIKHTKKKKVEEKNRGSYFLRCIKLQELLFTKKIYWKMLSPGFLNMRPNPSTRVELSQTRFFYFLSHTFSATKQDTAQKRNYRQQDSTFKLSTLTPQRNLVYFNKIVRCKK